MRGDSSYQQLKGGLLNNLLEAQHADGKRALATALRRRGRAPSTCWYPSAGNCFRDLWAWHQWRPYRVPVPRLFIHTDYRGPCSGIDCSDPNSHAMTIEERHPLCLRSDVLYEVSSSYAAHAGLASPEPKVELLLLSLDTDILRTKTPQLVVPVLYFYFENINWFESMVFSKGVRFSHFFKRQEGLTGGGSRASVINLFPYFGGSGCRHLLLDPEIQIDHGIIKRLWGRYSDHGRRPFHLAERRASKAIDLDDASAKRPDSFGEPMRYFRLIPVREDRFIESGNFDDLGPIPLWLERALKKITAATPWDDKFTL